MRTIKGVVTSVAMDKTIVVSVVSYKSHAKYKKSYKTTSKFYAHDEANTCKINDTVVIQESRPLSKMKRWTLIEKIEA